MKNFYSVAIFLMAFFTGFSQTKPDTLWTKTMGGSLWEAYGSGFQSKSAIALSEDEKSLYIASTTSSNDGFVTDSLGSLDGWLIKLDAQTGDTLWTDVLGGSYWDQILDVTATPDGGCVVCGYSNSLDGDFENRGLHLSVSMPDYVYSDGFIGKY